MENVIITCPACKGTGALGGSFKSSLIHECPWCQTTGNVSADVEKLFHRLHALTPSYGRFTNVWGNDCVVRKSTPRKC